jgi:CRP-like cAMP-binding protein
VYHFAQLGWRAENPGYLKSEACACASELFPCGPHLGWAIQLAEVRSMIFDLAAFLATAGVGRRIVQLKPQQVFFSQGSPADSIFYLRLGRAKLTVVSHEGKEATISLLTAGEFIGEESLAAGGRGQHMATASAITACTALRIEREEMIRMMYQEHSLSEMYLKFLLVRSMRAQADLVDQLFNSSEKRLARILLLMAEFGEPGEPEGFIPPITQETLAEMVGTTRSRVSFFMNSFRKLGLIEYNYRNRIRVHKSLLNVVLLDQFTERNPEGLPGSATPRVRSKPTRRIAA